MKKVIFIIFILLIFIINSSEFGYAESDNNEFVESDVYSFENCRFAFSLDLNYISFVLIIKHFYPGLIEFNDTFIEDIIKKHESNLDYNILNKNDVEKLKLNYCSDFSNLSKYFKYLEERTFKRNYGTIDKLDFLKNFPFIVLIEQEKYFNEIIKFKKNNSKIKDLSKEIIYKYSGIVVNNYDESFKFISKYFQPDQKIINMTLQPTIKLKDNERESYSGGSIPVISNNDLEKYRLKENKDFYIYIKLDNLEDTQSNPIILIHELIHTWDFFYLLSDKLLNEFSNIEDEKTKEKIILLNNIYKFCPGKEISSFNLILTNIIYDINNLTKEMNNDERMYEIMLSLILSFNEFIAYTISNSTYSKIYKKPLSFYDWFITNFERILKYNKFDEDNIKNKEEKLKGILQFEYDNLTKLYKNNFYEFYKQIFIKYIDMLVN